MLSAFLSNSNQLCAFVSSAVVKEQVLHSQCVAGQIVAVRRTCIFTWAAAGFYAFVIHVEPV